MRQGQRVKAEKKIASVKTKFNFCILVVVCASRCDDLYANEIRNYLFSYSKYIIIVIKVQYSIYLSTNSQFWKRNETATGHIHNINIFNSHRRRQLINANVIESNLMKIFGQILFDKRLKCFGYEWEVLTPRLGHNQYLSFWIFSAN